MPDVSVSLPLFITTVLSLPIIGVLVKAAFDKKNADATAAKVSVEKDLAVAEYKDRDLAHERERNQKLEMRIDDKDRRIAEKDAVILAMETERHQYKKEVEDLRREVAQLRTMIAGLQTRLGMREDLGETRAEL